MYFKFDLTLTEAVDTEMIYVATKQTVLTALKISICIIETWHWEQTVNICTNLVSSQTIYM